MSTGVGCPLQISDFRLLGCPGLWRVRFLSFTFQKAQIRSHRPRNIGSVPREKTRKNMGRSQRETCYHHYSAAALRVEFSNAACLRRIQVAIESLTRANGHPVRPAHPQPRPPVILPRLAQKGILVFFLRIGTHTCWHCALAARSRRL